MKDLLNNLPIISVGILVSGNGNNMENLIRTIHNVFINFKDFVVYDKNEDLENIDYINSRKIEITCVVSNNINAPALQRAKNLKIRTYVTDNIFFNSVIDSKNELGKILLNLDFLLLAGFMKVLKKDFLSSFRHTKILNIHPSFLPLHKGLDAISKSFNDENNFGGVSIHLVNEDIDSGDIILQEKLLKIENEAIEDFEDRIHALEYICYPRAFLKLVRETYGKA